jgi:toluene monooxygenase electron transfer component
VRKDELAALPGYGATLNLSIAVSEPDAAWTGLAGFVHEHARAFIGERWAAFDYYFAGPPPMVEACSAC